MIDRIRLANFKRFGNLNLRMAPLTVLTGRNSSGKSTVVQALLLVRQSIVSDQSRRGTVELNGPFNLELGEASEVLNVTAGGTVIEFGLRTDDGNQATWSMRVADERNLYLQVERRPTASVARRFMSGGFWYLAAERLGPRDAQVTASHERGALQVGTRGEFLAQFLYVFGREPVRQQVLHPETATRGGGVSTLLRQSELWTGDIVTPIEIDAQWFPNTNVSVLRFKGPGVRTEWLRPANVGFGFSYSLPVIVAALAAREKSLFIVENPEAHLHPRGQSLLARLLARLAASGAQVLVETHSDHVLNGIRRAVLSAEGPSHRDVIIHYFGGDDGLGVNEIQLTRRGSLTEWPSGFFDQLEEDLTEISRPVTET